MRYYEVYLPNAQRPLFTSNARRLRHLPDGTRVVAVTTGKDGTPVARRDLPVKDGRVVFSRKNSEARTLLR